MKDDTGIEQDEIIKTLRELKNVMWDEKVNFVYVRRFRVYNGGGAPENVKKAIAAEFLQSSTLTFWNSFVEDYPEFKDAILATGRPLMPRLPLNNPVTNSNTNTNTIEPLVNGSPTVVQPLDKKRYGQFSNVLLTDSDIKKLQERFGNKFQEHIESASEYFEKIGPVKTAKNYKSHYATILTWARNEEKAGGAQNATKPAPDPRKW
jgi:hypothetical protein